MLRSTLALCSIALSILGRSLLNLSSLFDIGSSVQESNDAKYAQDPMISAFYYVLLEAAPSVLVLVAIGEQVMGTTFNAEGVVPWTLRVSEEEVSFGAMLGEGAFGVVLEGTWRGHCVAIKRLKTAGLDTMQLGQLRTALEREATLMARLRHPNVVQFLY